MNRLLACLDGSDYTPPLLSYTAWAARTLGLGVDALYVTDPRQFELPLISEVSGTLGFPAFSELVQQLRHYEDEKAALLAQNAGRRLAEETPPPDLRFHHRQGALVEHLSEFEHGVELVLLGKRGERAQYAPEHLGASLERVLRAAQRPVLVTSRHYHEPRRAMVAFDGGPLVRKALDFLLRTKGWHHLDLHVVNVAPPGDEAEGLALVTEAAERLEDVGLRPVTQVLTGNVEETLWHYAETRRLDLIIMGAYGQGRLRELFLGSTTAAIIRTCRVPVLCFR